MKITLDLISASFDDNRLPDEIKEDIFGGCRIYIFNDIEEYDLNDEFAYSLFIEYGENSEHTLMFHVKLSDLEMFAHSLLKSIEIFRRDYLDEIKERIKKGDVL